MYQSIPHWNFDCFIAQIIADIFDSYAVQLSRAKIRSVKMEIGGGGDGDGGCHQTCGWRWKSSINPGQFVFLLVQLLTMIAVFSLG